MNKAELIRTVAGKSGLSRKDAAGAVSAMLEAIPEELKNGGNVQLIGFGTFCMKERPARTYRNPHNGEKVEVPARRLPCFRPGAPLRNAVR